MEEIFKNAVMDVSQVSFTDIENHSRVILRGKVVIHHRNDGCHRRAVKNLDFTTGVVTMLNGDIKI